MAQQKYRRIGSTIQTVAAGTATSTMMTNGFGAQTFAVTLCAVAAFRFKLTSGTGDVLIPATNYGLVPAGVPFDMNVSPGQKYTFMADTVTTVVSVMEHE